MVDHGRVAMQVHKSPARLVISSLGVWNTPRARRPNRASTSRARPESKASWGLYLTCFMFFVGLSAGGLLVASSASIFGMDRPSPST